MGPVGRRRQPFHGLPDELSQLAAVDPAGAGHLGPEGRAPVDRRPSPAGPQRDHRPVVPQRQACLELVAEGLPGLARHDPLPALVPARREQPHGAQTLGCPLARRKELEGAEGRPLGPGGPVRQERIHRRRIGSRRRRLVDHLLGHHCLLSVRPRRGVYHLVHGITNEHRRGDGGGGRHAGGGAPAPPQCRRGALHDGRPGRPEPAPNCRGDRVQPSHAAVPLRIQGRPVAGGRARGGGPDPGPAGRVRPGHVWETDVLIRRMWSYLSDPALGDFERLFFALYGRALQGDDAIRSLLDDDVAHWLDANVALSTPLGCRRRRPGRTPASGWPSRAACCSTCSPRVTARGWKAPSRPSRRTTAAGGGSFRRAPAKATAPRRGRGARGSR